MISEARGLFLSKQRREFSARSDKSKIIVTQINRVADFLFFRCGAQTCLFSRWHPRANQPAKRTIRVTASFGWRTISGNYSTPRPFCRDGSRAVRQHGRGVPGGGSRDGSPGQHGVPRWTQDQSADSGRCRTQGKVRWAGLWPQVNQPPNPVPLAQVCWLWSWRQGPPHHNCCSSRLSWT